MFTDKLFDHKYDIDDIIQALCTPSGRTVLNTRDGSVCHEENSSDIQDGDDNGYLHILEPLPSSFLKEITSHEKFFRLTEEEKSEIQNLLSNVQKCSTLPELFEQGMAGGFIRESVKRAAMEWLDMKNMIPPSMRHVTDISMLGTVPNNPSRVKIQFND